MLNGIICVDKPSDWTSFDVVAKMRGIVKMRKIGHAGTLDPMATGVLPLFLGSATKACSLLPDQDKIYLATLQFGVTTDTLDRTGTVTKRSDQIMTCDQLEAIMPDFMGEITQLPPMYSAVKVGGTRLYQLARAGKTVERKLRTVQIHKMELRAFDALHQTAQLYVHCSKGTYIRTLADDIGAKLGVGAMLIALTREMAAGFTREDCYTLAELQQMADEQRLSNAFIPTERAFCAYQAIRLSEMQASMFLNGVSLDLHRVHCPPSDQQSYRIYNQQDDFLGLAYTDALSMKLRIKKIF